MELPVKKGLKPSDPNFVAPDGGWAWIIAFACGFSNLCIFTMFEQYGLTFVDEFKRLEISHLQMTTIFNINASLTALIGLFNGPIYRKYSYRQMALLGSTLVAISLFSLIWCKSFWTYLVFYGILYGLAIGITQTANAIALNTYFQRNRSVATGISWGITGIGSSGCPHAINILLTIYGIHGTLLLFAGLSCHAIMCSLLLQPVQWHAKNKIEETDFPLMPLERNKSNSLPVHGNLLSKFMIDNHPFEYIDTCIESPSIITEDSKIFKSCLNAYQDPMITICKSEPCLENFPMIDNQNGCFSTFSQKCVSFFDLVLLKDLVYLNIIVGKTIICFAEFNFALLSPLILKEFHLERYQIAVYLSILGGVDTIFRVLLPFITNKIKLNCRVYFLLGALITTIGRITLINTQSYSVLLVVAAIIGFGKALRIIYMALVIPDYVPLEKLPAALGIYMTMFGVCMMALAPLVGIVRNITTSYVITIHLLNILIYIVTISWCAEYFYRKRKL